MAMINQYKDTRNFFNHQTNQWQHERRTPLLCDGLDARTKQRKWLYSGDIWQPIDYYPYRHFYLWKHLRNVNGKIVLCYKVLSYGSYEPYIPTNNPTIVNAIPQRYLQAQAQNQGANPQAGQQMGQGANAPIAVPRGAQPAHQAQPRGVSPPPPARSDDGSSDYSSELADEAND